MVEDWKTLKAERDKRFYFGFGWGADMNGFHSSGRPRGADAANPVDLPVQVLGRQADDLQADDRRAHLGHQRRRRRPLRPVPRLGRGHAQAGRRPDRQGPGPRRRGLPARCGSARSACRLHGRSRRARSSRARACSASSSARATRRCCARPASPPRAGRSSWRYGIQKRPIKNGSVYAVSAGRALGPRGAAPASSTRPTASTSATASTVPGSGGSDGAAGDRHQGAAATSSASATGKVVFTGVTSLRGKALRAAVARLGVL